MKKTIISLLIAVTLLFTGCTWFAKGEDKTFEKAGMSITLTDYFREESMSGFTVCYGSEDVAVLCLKEQFSDNPGHEDLTLDEYMELVREVNKSLSPSEITKVDGLTSITYTASGKETYDYFTVAYKAPDGFWLVQFCALTQNYDTLYPDFVKWAKSVRFDQE